MMHVYDCAKARIRLTEVRIMTSLGCNVTNCGYNEDRCCCRTEIEVMGTKAEEKDCTCCGSFDSGCDCRNSVSGPKESLYVHCEASNCIYNEDLYAPLTESTFRVLLPIMRDKQYVQASHASSKCMGISPKGCHRQCGSFLFFRNYR